MAVTLKQVQGLGPLQRSYKWNVSFLVEGGTNAETTETTEVSETNNNNTSASLSTLLNKVNIRCISASIPTPKIDNVDAAPHGIDITEPGIVHLVGEIDFKIVETTDLISRQILHKLQQLAMTDNQKKQYDIHGTTTSGSYYYDLTAKLQRLDNQNKVNMTYYCYKCFITDFTDPGFESTSGDVEPSFKLRYNYFTVSIKNNTTANVS